MNRILWLVAVFALLCPVAVKALDFEAEARAALADEKTSPLPAGLSVGPGIYFAGKTYLGEDSELIPVPTVFYRGDRASFFVKQGSYRLWADEEWGLELGAVADLRLDGYKAEDSDALEGMDDRNPTIDAGLQLEMELPVGELELTGLHDALSQHDGYEVSLAYSVPIIIGRFYIKPSIGLSYQSEDLVDYYYGVPASEAGPERPSYAPGDTWGWSASLVSTYRLSERWLLMGMIEYEGFGDEIQDSPIVSENGELNAVFGIGYHF